MIVGLGCWSLANFIFPCAIHICSGCANICRLMHSRLPPHHAIILSEFKTHQRFIRSTKIYISTVAYRFDMISGSLCTLDSACLIASPPHQHIVESAIAFWLPVQYSENAKMPHQNISALTRTVADQCDFVFDFKDSYLIFVLFLSGNELYFSSSFLFFKKMQPRSCTYDFNPIFFC